MKNIAHVILWSNGMVMVFDADGEQMPEYQGKVEEVKPKIDAVFTGRWQSGDWNMGFTCNLDEEPAWLTSKRTALMVKIAQEEREREQAQ